jgi:hypothetical protein
MLTSDFKEKFVRGLLQSLKDNGIRSDKTKVKNVRCGSIVADVEYFETDTFDGILSLINQGLFKLYVDDTIFTAIRASLNTGLHGAVRLGYEDNNFSDFRQAVPQDILWRRDYCSFGCRLCPDCAGYSSCNSVQASTTS